jgi:hypothetical protein
MTLFLYILGGSLVAWQVKEFWRLGSFKLKSGFSNAYHLYVYLKLAVESLLEVYSRKT